DTHAVLEAAGTKWNFLPFKPGLVGGHCIGVDPYYLAQKAQEHGYHPEIILAGRRLNDSMGDYVAAQVVKSMIKNNIKVNGAEVLMLGVTFKENCPDVRNTKIVDVVKALKEYSINVTIYAQEHGYHPEIILAGRRLNDSMGDYVAAQVVKSMIKNNIKVNGAEVLMLGVTFKENCPDVRNTKIVDVVKALKEYSINVTIYD